LETLRSLLPPALAEVLDVGTGTGFLALLLAELRYRVVGIDLAPDMLEIARSKCITRLPLGLNLVMPLLAPFRAAASM
jgi:ubiquinone/menaquinone biosynthesis C-methylase UbiE